MKVLLIGRTTCYGARRIEEECVARGIECIAVPPAHLVVMIRDGTVSVTTKEGKDLLEHDVFYFRGFGKYAGELSVIARFLKQHNKIVIEDVFAETVPYFDKLTAVLTDPTIPYVESTLVFSLSKEILSETMYPCIVKSLQGSMGRCVELVQTKEELQTTCRTLGYPVLLQKYIPITHDYRVVVVDGKPLGALKRFRMEDDFLTTRKGGLRECVELPQEALDCAVTCTEKSGLSVAGVDLLEHEGRFYCIEVNMSPQFRVFEKITKANVAGAICDMMVKKFKNSSQ